MFEHSVYNIEPATVPMEEGGLFHDYEIKTWEFSPRIYKILGIAAAANLFALFIFAQTSLLTMKGCDSPLVSSVCQALDVVYVGAMLYGTDREYVDAKYDKTDLGEAEITYVDVSGVTPPLSYPEGYFQIANPEEYAMLQQQASDPMFNPGLPPGFPTTPPSTSGHSLIDTAPKVPKRNNDLIDGDLPTFNGSTTSSNPPIKGRKPSTSKTPGDGTNASTDGQTNNNTDPNKTVDPTDSATSYDINKRPFVDLANNVNDLLDKKQVKLESPFVVSAHGKLTKEGKLDPKSFRWGPVSSTDQKMIDVVKGAVEAINDSGYLQYLKDLSGKDFNLTLQQDETSISALVQSDMESEMRARSISSALSFAISVARKTKSGENADQNDKDDLILLENAKVEAIGKKVVIKFLVPKEIALPMIQRKLAEQKAAPKQQNGNAVGGLANKTAVK